MSIYKDNKRNKVIMKNLAKTLFKLRSYTPIPFVILMLIFYNGNVASWILGGIVILSGEFLRLWGVTYAGSLTRTTTSVKANELITSGPFAHVRNPLYIGNILIYVGFGILSMALFPYLPIIALAWFIFQYTLIIDIEQEFLESKFGQIYEEYKENVPKIIPRLLPYKTYITQNIEPDFKKGFKSERRTMQAILVIALIALIIHMVK